MALSVLEDKAVVPDDEQLEAAIGKSFKLWNDIRRHIVERYDKIVEEWSYSGKNYGCLRSQIVISNMRTQSVTSRTSLRGGRRFVPYAFTEQGVAMLSSVLRSLRAVEVNVQIMRAFVRLRQLLAVHRELADRLTRLEQQMRKRDQSVDQQFRQIFELLNQLFSPPDPPRKPIGFHGELDAPKLPKGRYKR